MNVLLWKGFLLDIIQKEGYKSVYIGILVDDWQRKKRKG